jgi:hypothetical protein
MRDVGTVFPFSTVADRAAILHHMSSLHITPCIGGVRDFITIGCDFSA